MLTPRQLFARSLVGLDRAAVLEAFSDFLDESTYNVTQVRFMTMVIDELTATGVMEPSRLYESPYTDDMPQGPDAAFPNGEVVAIIDRLRAVKQHAQVEWTPA